MSEPQSATGETSSLAELHSARRGTYRVIYCIDDAQRTVAVLGVFARADAYRRR